MPKTEAEWTREWEKTEGDEFEKSLALLRAYSGFVKQIGGGGLFGKVLSGRWGSHNTKEVQEAIRPYYDESNSSLSMAFLPRQYSIIRNKTVYQLFQNLSIVLTAAQHTLSKEGDLLKIINVIEKKTGQRLINKEDLIEKKGVLLRRESVDLLDTY